MPRRSSSEDINEAAIRILRQATGEEPESVGSVLIELERRLSKAELLKLAGAILGRHGGKRGGKARAEKLSAQRRKEIAKKAADARWDQAKPPQK